MAYPISRADKQSELLACVQGPGEQFMAAVIGPGQRVAGVIDALQTKKAKAMTHPLVRNFLRDFKALRAQIEADRQKLENLLDMFLTRDDDTVKDLLKFEHPYSTMGVTLTYEYSRVHWALVSIRNEVEASQIDPAHRPRGWEKFEYVDPDIASELEREFKDLVDEHCGYIRAWNKLAGHIKKVRKEARKEAAQQAPQM